MSIISKKTEKVICAVLLLIIAASLVKSVLIDPGNGRIPVGKILMLNSQWEEVQHEKDETYCEYAYVIPENSASDPVFSMENGWVSIKVFLDGQELFACEDTYREFGERQEWIELPGDVSGRTLTLGIAGGHKAAERIMKNPMYLGEKNAVFLKSLNSGLYALFFFLFTLILTVIIFVCRIGLKESLPSKNIREMRNLAFFTLDAGIWVLTDSQILQLFVDGTAVIAFVSFAAFLMMPLFLLSFIKEMMVYPWRRFDTLIRIGLVNTAVILGVSLFRILPIYKLLFLQHFLIIATIPLILQAGITEVKKYQNYEVKKIIIGFGFLSGSGVAALLMFYVNSSVNYAYFYTIGFLLFIVCLIRAVFGEVYFYLERNAKMEIYRKMAYMDEMTGMKNRTAFEKALEKESSARGLAYIMFDNNNLKEINDQYGHQAGDQLLKETANCIRESFERFGRCFRIGGDEFLVILKGMSEEAIKGGLEHFERSLAEVNQKREIPIGVAYGYFLCEDESMTPRELFKKADSNMYSQKQEMKKG